jgi:hypothetical protein
MTQEAPTINMWEGFRSAGICNCHSPSSPAKPSFDHGARVADRETAEKFIAWATRCDESTARAATVCLERGTPQTFSGAQTATGTARADWRMDVVAGGVLFAHFPGGFAMVRPARWNAWEAGQRQPVMDRLEIEWAGIPRV